MNRYKLFIFVTVFWWSLLCPTSLGFPSDIISQNTTPHLSFEDTNSKKTSKIQIKPRFKYLTFLNKYLED